MTLGGKNGGSHIMIWHRVIKEICTELTSVDSSRLLGWSPKLYATLHDMAYNKGDLFFYIFCVRDELS